MVSRLPGAQLEAPRTNTALRLAEVLSTVTPEAQQAFQSIAEKRAKTANERAQRDVLLTNGQGLADAVRSGALRPTQNPWYIRAYNREAAALTSKNQLQQLQVESDSWEEKNDPAAFQERWNKEAGEIGSEYSSRDQLAGFNAAANLVSSQVLQQNTAYNTKRIEGERYDNLSALGADAIKDAWTLNGGRLTPNQLWATVQPVREQWFATGGSLSQWYELQEKMLVSAAAGVDGGVSLLDLARAPEYVHGPSASGDVEVGLDAPEYSATSYTIETPDELGAAFDAALTPRPEGVATALTSQPSPVARITAPPAKLRSPLANMPNPTSGFGRRRRPTKGASTNHQGVDYPAPTGTPVMAEAVGKVVFSGRDGGHGETVKVDYGNGLVATYAHLSARDVKVRDIVAAGQGVGKVGATGVVTGPHLHHRYDLNGKPIDPRTYKGRVGGTFEADPARAQEPATPGFPGADRPFSDQQADGSLPPHRIDAGPSLYDLPGVAERMNTAAYYLRRQEEDRITFRMKTLDAKRRVRGYEGVDLLYEEYGSDITRGNVTPGDQQNFLRRKGYSEPEIAAAMGQLRGNMQDIVAVQQATLAARQQNPGNAIAILNLFERAQTEGYQEGMENELGEMILSGDLDLDDAQRVLSLAHSTSQRKKSEQRQAESDARAEYNFEQKQKDVTSFAGLKANAKGRAAAIVQSLRSQLKAAGQGTNVLEIDAKGNIPAQDRWEEIIANAMLSYITNHPGDWDGAIAHGEKQAISILNTARLNWLRTQKNSTGPVLYPRGGGSGASVTVKPAGK